MREAAGPFLCAPPPYPPGPPFSTRPTSITMKKTWKMYVGVYVCR